MAACPAVVPGERGSEREHLGGHIRRHRSAGAGLSLRGSFEIPCRPRSPGNLEPLGCLVGKKHRHLEKRCHGEQRPAEPLGRDEGDGRSPEHGPPPKDFLLHTVAPVEDPPDHDGDQDGQGERAHQGRDGQQGGEGPMWPPAVLAKFGRVVGSRADRSSAEAPSGSHASDDDQPPRRPLCNQGT